MTLHEFINKRLAELGLKRSALVDGDINWSTLSNIKAGRPINEVTKQRLALVLKCSQGEIQACLAEQNPLKKVIVNKKSLAKLKPKTADPEPEPEELPFDDLPEEEPEEGEDMKWYPDIPNEESEQVKELKVKTTPELERVAKENPGTLQSEAPLLSGSFLDDKVNHPAHYTQGAVECIEAIKASMTASEFRGYLKGNAMKYMWRYQHKGGVEDLKKARWYLDRLIEDFESINKHVKDRFGDFDHLKPM